VPELLLRFALAFGIGLLIGLERGWHSRDARSGSRAAGVRTFTITGLLGGVVAALASSDGQLDVPGAIVFSAVFLVYAAVITTFSREQALAAGTFSATTATAALLTFALGGYALLGDERIAAACAVATAGILSIREPLHAWVARVTATEFYSALVLLAMTFIALPVLPDRSIGPFGGVNPRAVWLIAIMLAMISFAGYIAVRLLGEHKGTLVAAAAGGLVSSTAVTLANARRALAGEGTPRVLAAGVMAAMAVSFVRVAVIVLVLKPQVALLIVPALFTGAAFATVGALVCVLTDSVTRPMQQTVRFGNPFGFWSVLLMAVSIGVLMVVGRLINAKFGSIGAIASAAAMGLFDVDAMTVSMLRLTADATDLLTMTYAILVGVAANTFSKVALGAVIARGTFAVQIAVVCAGSVVAGWLGLLATLAVIEP
jgi:uncharacterized membrane protein (DUF4010 family)